MSKRRTLAVMAGVLGGLVVSCARSNRSEAWFRPQRVDASMFQKKFRPAREMPPPKILPQTHFAAGRLFEARGQFAKAIEQYRKATLVNHDYFEAFHRLGVLLSLTGQHEEAMAALTRAVELRPDDAFAHNNLGFELMLQKRLAEAENQYRQAIVLKPDFARAYINLGIVQARQHRFDEALASFRVVLPDVDAYYNVGLMYRAQNRFAEAADAFRHVLALNPQFDAARRQLERLQQEHGIPMFAGQPEGPPEDARGLVAAAEQPQKGNDGTAFEKTSPPGGMARTSSAGQVREDEAWNEAVRLFDRAFEGNTGRESTSTSARKTPRRTPTNPTFERNGTPPSSMVDLDTLLACVEDPPVCWQTETPMVVRVSKADRRQASAVESFFGPPFDTFRDADAFSSAEPCEDVRVVDTEAMTALTGRSEDELVSEADWGVRVEVERIPVCLADTEDALAEGDSLDSHALLVVLEQELTQAIEEAECRYARRQPETSTPAVAETESDAKGRAHLSSLRTEPKPRTRRADPRFRSIRKHPNRRPSNRKRIDRPQTSRFVRPLTRMAAGREFNELDALLAIVRNELNCAGEGSEFMSASSLSDEVCDPAIPVDWFDMEPAALPQPAMKDVLGMPSPHDRRIGGGYGGYRIRGQYGHELRPYP